MAGMEGVITAVSLVVAIVIIFIVYKLLYEPHALTLEGSLALKSAHISYAFQRKI